MKVYHKPKTNLKLKHGITLTMKSESFRLKSITDHGKHTWPMNELSRYRPDIFDESDHY